MGLKNIQDPELFDVLQDLKRDIFRSMNCVKVGKIETFDKSKKKATVSIKIKMQKADGNYLDYPVLADVHVVTLQGGGAGIEFPIAAGDDCIVFFSDSNLDFWWETGAAGIPYDGRTHDISDSFCIVGVNSSLSTLSDYIASTARMFNGTAEISMKNNLITIKNGVTDLLTFMDTLIDTIAAVQTSTNIALRASDITALQALKTSLALLLHT